MAVLEIDGGENIYIMITGKCHKSELFFFFLREWLVTIYSTSLAGVEDY